jgi:glutamine amidotransferase
VTSVAVIDHGAGNLVSMERALQRSGATVVIVDRATDLSDFDGVVLPGVGATGPAMRTLRRTGLDRSLCEAARPLLGVCVGMQLLFEHSLEDATACLGLLGGVVRPLAASPLPHMGWNDVVHDGAAPFTTVAPSAPCYFVHSYAPLPDDEAVIAATTTYGSDRFVSAVRQGPIMGVQFHPERSGSAGLAVLADFVAMCGRDARAA